MAIQNEQERIKQERQATLERYCQDPRFNETTTKREMFAAMALQGLLANPNIIGGMPAHTLASEDAAEMARGYADALIAELEKQ